MLALLVVLPVLAWEIGSETNKGNTSEKVVRAKPGPWGNLDYVPIDIEIPDHFANPDQVEPTDWFFKGSTRDQVIEILKTCELQPEQLQYLLGKAEWTNEAEGCHVLPADDFVWSLSEASRAKLYSALAPFPENINQFYAFSFRVERLPRRFEHSGLSEETIAMFKKLLYPQASVVRFADSDLVLRKIQDPNEKKKFIKMISRRSSLLVKLKVTPDSDLDALENYWGQGGRSKDLRPFLESLTRVAGGCKIDIAHLLPPFARQRIYTYPDPSVQSQGFVQDCHWTSLNFFSGESSPAYGGPEEVRRRLLGEFASVGYGISNARFGDVVLLKNKDDIIIHSAVYIADDIVFTKNGSGSNQPWIYMKMEDMLPFYEMPNDIVQIVTYRRKQI